MGRLSGYLFGFLASVVLVAIMVSMFFVFSEGSGLFSIWEQVFSLFFFGFMTWFVLIRVVFIAMDLRGGFEC